VSRRPCLRELHPAALEFVMSDGLPPQALLHRWQLLP